MYGIVRALFRGALWIGGFALLVAGVMNFFFVDRIQIRHNAMAPTLYFGDEALVWRSKGADYAMGDIVVCAHPENPAEFVIGRVVGKPGMTIEATRGQLKISGSIPDRSTDGRLEFEDFTDGLVHEISYGTEKLATRYHRFFERVNAPLEMALTPVEEGLFLLADYRGSRGYDSRTFGEVDPSTCIGTVFFRLRPTEHAPPELKPGWFDIIR